EVHRDRRGLDHHATGGVEDRRAAVAPLLDVRAVGAAHERRLHLLRDGAQRVAHHLQGDRVHPAAAHRRSITTPPSAPASARRPAATRPVAPPAGPRAGPPTPRAGGPPARSGSAPGRWAPPRSEPPSTGRPGDASP